MPSMYYQVVAVTHEGYPTLNILMTVEFRNAQADPLPFRTRIVAVDPNNTPTDARDTIRNLCREEYQKQIEEQRAETATQPYPTGVLGAGETYTW